MRKGCSPRWSAGPSARSLPRSRSTGRSTTSSRSPSRVARSFRRVGPRRKRRNRRRPRRSAWSASMPKRILIDARTPVHYAMFAPVHAAMASDDRVQFYFIASEEHGRAAEIFKDAAGRATIVSPARAALMKFDAYVTSDFMLTRLLHKTCRIQMFHGVGGKYGFDAPTESLRAWHRLFFVNRRRLDN